MRFTMLTLLAFAAAQAANAQASQAPDGATEIVLSPSTLSGEVSGVTLPDKRLTYFVRAPSHREMTIKVAADNGPCGFEMQRSSSSGFQSDMGRFPDTRIFTAQENETFTFSFFQTRTGYMEQKGCTFTLSVN
ncbi:hypothetical protein [Rhizobium sp. C4]|uniref:hypothetical protein n=1 Tax=Rhizobium sp. C4 TaxID=1349800 RepID=UPI001E57E009|nr:hypothetical protein [Rhizobium sp. C4]MCD2172037.1 hypothetical protein [Rhizobium sp. C4]